MKARCLQRSLARFQSFLVRADEEYDHEPSVWRPATGLNDGRGSHPVFGDEPPPLFLCRGKAQLGDEERRLPVREFDFEAFSNAGGQVLDLYLAEQSF